MLLFDTYDAADTKLADAQLPLHDLMGTQHKALAERIVGLSFMRLESTYPSRLDHLSPEQRVASLGRVYKGA